MGRQEVVRVRGLVKRYGGVAVVDGLGFGVFQGEVFGILGPNGAGKSTTVEILLGYRSRDAGEVSVFGQDPAGADRLWKSQVGIVWQDESAPGELTVAETVRHFARYYPRPRDPREVIALVGLEAEARRRVGSLSGGQRRRLDVALGVIGDPRLLLLDEPTTGFDPVARRRFWEMVRSLAAEGTTIVLTTHYLEEAEALADRLAVVVGGRLVASGAPGSLADRARGRATVRWIGPGGVERVEETDSPTRTVTELARRFGGEIPGLRITRPTLEDVYMALVAEEAG
jgi:ABC-2 type transport system ATP-binding protein